MTTFMTREELESVGFLSLGCDVSISRLAAIHYPERIAVGDHVRIDDFCYLSGLITIGNHVHLGSGVVVSAGNTGVVMDDYSGLSPKVIVIAESDDYTGETMTNSTVPLQYRSLVTGRVHIGRHVIVGAGSVVLPGVTISEGSSVGAMSLINKDTEPWAIYIGVPARALKKRSRRMLELQAEFEEDVNGQ